MVQVTASSTIWEVKKDTTLPLDEARSVMLIKGARGSISTYSVHRDPAVYANPDEYDPFRFAMNERPESLSTFNHTFLGWGIGKWACPGRYWAANTMRLVLMALFVNYHIKARENDGKNVTSRRPTPRLGMLLLPNMGVKLLVRKRR